MNIRQRVRQFFAQSGRALWLSWPVRSLRRLGLACWSMVVGALERSTRRSYWVDHVGRSDPLPVEPVSAGLNLLGYGLAAWLFWKALAAAAVAFSEQIKAFDGQDFAGAVLAITIFAYNRYRTKRRSGEAMDALREIAIIKEADFHPGLIKLSPKYREAGYVVVPYRHGVGCWSSRVSDWLLDKTGSHSLKIAIDDDGFTIDASAASVLAPKLALEALIQGKHFSNDAKIRLKGDGLISPWDGVRVVLEKTHYIATMCTNDMVGKVALAKKGNLLKGCDYRVTERMLTSEGMLREWDTIKLANQLGASTLAFTSDGYPIVVEQTGKNIQSENLLAPSGSGSFDWADLRRAEGRDFVEWASQAALRELFEECGLESVHCGADIASGMCPVGFGLYLHRGAKPELMFLGRIELTKVQFRRISTFSSIERQLSKIRSLDDAFRLQDGQWTAANVKAVCAGLLKDRRDQLSMPLEMLLEMVTYACDARPDRINAIRPRVESI